MSFTLLSVDCERNDPVDIRCGGPTMLGYDFIVPTNQLEGYKSLIQDALKIKQRPFLSFSTKPASGGKVWDASQVLECIEKGY